MKANSTSSHLFPYCCRSFTIKRLFIVLGVFLFNFTNIYAQPCIDPPVATLTATPSCNGAPFNLVLSSVTPASSPGPYDLVINGVTYNDIPLGGAIIPTTTPGIDETLFGVADPTATPSDDPGSVELGVKFSATKSGFITGVRFFSPAAPTGTYTGNLWTSNGTLLASAVFTGVTGSSWQEVSFSSPVAINANTTYIASYHSSDANYVATLNFFTLASHTNGASLRSPQATVGNGVYSYGAGPSLFPSTSDNNDANYWVDVRFVAFPQGETGFGTTSPSPTYFSDEDPVELGAKFSSSQEGFITAIRFFSPPVVLGTFTGHLWSASGTLLGTAQFSNVTADSWQEAALSTPVHITAGTTYIVSYYTSTGRYRATPLYFTAPHTSGSLTFPQGAGPVLVGGGTGNGLFSYDLNVPDSSNDDANYWADVIFVPVSNTFNLTSVTDNTGCNNTGALQSLTITYCNTLPVTLVNLSATPKDNNSIVIKWTTSSEINNLGFELQRSTDGRNWNPVTFINGAGNSTSTINYSYVDENLSANRYYYRLKQVDIDQKFVYSAIVSATLNGKEIYALEQNFPNPFKAETILKFSLPRSTKINLSLFDMNGKLVKVIANGSKEAGTHAISFNAGSLNSGIYYYKLQTEDFSSVKKMIVQ